MTILAIDIGNSTVTIGLFLEGDLRKKLSLPTHPYGTLEEYQDEVRAFLEREGVRRRHVGAIVASVVPRLEDVVTRAVGHLTLKTPLKLEGSLSTGLVFDVFRPEEVGADRVANAVAATEMGGNQVIVVDFGTATTCSCIRGRRFIGGAILPGVGLMAESLHSRTARLPDVDIVSEMKERASLSVVGKDTKGCIVSAIIYGTAGAVERLLEEMEREAADTFSLVITGGYAPLVAPFLRRNYRHEPDLTLHGLRLIYERNS